MEDAGTSEVDDIVSQDSNTPIDHGHLARNCLIKITTPAVKASVVFQHTGSVNELSRSERPGMSKQTVDNVQAALQRSPQKLICLASWELHKQKSTIHNVLRKRLQLHAFILKITRALQPNDRP